MERELQTPTDERLEQALRALPRIKPANDLAARIIATLPPPRAATHARAVGALMALAAALGLGLAYQTAFDMSMRGAFDLLADYAAQPAIVTLYPRQAFDALAQAIPWFMVALSASALGLAALLAARLTARTRAALWQRV